MRRWCQHRTSACAMAEQTFSARRFSLPATNGNDTPVPEPACSSAASNQVTGADDALSAALRLVLQEARALRFDLDELCARTIDDMEDADRATTALAVRLLQGARR